MDCNNCNAGRRHRCFYSTSERPTSCTSRDGRRPFRRCCVTACVNWSAAVTRGCSTCSTRSKRRPTRWPSPPSPSPFRWPTSSRRRWDWILTPSIATPPTALRPFNNRRRRLATTTTPTDVRPLAICPFSTLKSNTAFFRSSFSLQFLFIQYSITNHNLFKSISFIISS